VSEVVRVGVIGSGRQGARHISTYLRLQQAHLVAVADPSAEARQVALGGLEALEYDDWQELLSRHADDLDAISVACPSEKHAEVAAAALCAGLHVLVEKPIATTLEDACALARLARRKNRKLMVGHIERFNPAVAKLRTLVAEGRLGRVFRAHATRIGPSPMRAMGAGVALDLATHDLDAMEFVLDRRVTKIYADQGNFRHGVHEDMVTCLLRFDDDVRGLLDVNWLTPEKQRELVVVGEGGMLRASYLTQDVWFIESTDSAAAWSELATIRGDSEGSAIKFALRRVEPIRAELEAFLQCIVDDTVEPVTAYDGARALAAALGVLESARERQPVEITQITPPRSRKRLAAAARARQPLVKVA